MGSFLSATHHNPSHSWRVHHTHRALFSFSQLHSLTLHTPGKYTTPTWALFCRLRTITPHTPGEYNTLTGLFCVGYAPYPLPLLESLPHPQGSFVSATFLNPSHSRNVHHTHRALFSRFLNAQKVHHTHRALLSWLRSLTPHTPHHIHMAFFVCL